MSTHLKSKHWHLMAGSLSTGERGRNISEYMGTLVTLPEKEQGITLQISLKHSKPTNFRVLYPRKSGQK